MLSFLELTNFKSFKSISFDLRKAHGVPKKMALIYGENGSGKSNLISSLMFLEDSLRTLNDLRKRKELPEYNENIDSMIDDKTLQPILKRFFQSQFFTLSDLIKRNKMIAAPGQMSLKFGFRLKNSDGSYYMQFSEDEIVKEELYYRKKEREGVVFSIAKNRVTLSPSVFFDSVYKKELRGNIEKYWGKHSFMALLLEEIDIKNDDYIKTKFSESLFDVINWLKAINIQCKQPKSETTRISVPSKLMGRLENGIVSDKNDKELTSYESALNTFFTQLYSDIKRVYYVFAPEDKGYSYDLYLQKLIDGVLIDIPFSLESTGTRKLLEIFPLLFASVAGLSVFIDEIDTGVHDLLMKSLFESLEDSLEGQLIATTHNTLLMESYSPEETYIIRVNANGEKSINSIADYEQRTQKNNNIRNKYLRGDYDGIPFIGYIDLHELVKNVMDDVHPSKVEKDGAEE